MKLRSLDKEYLRGIIDGKIADYNTHYNAVPENFGYSFEFSNYRGTHIPNPSTVKITFNWVLNPVAVMVDEDTNSFEIGGEKGDDCFTILITESVEKLQMYVEEILDRITR
jgi:hypothetical protein